MKWRDKLHQMALIDILYMLNENGDKINELGICIRDLVTGKASSLCSEYGCDCKKCLESFLNEDIEKG